MHNKLNLIPNEEVWNKTLKIYKDKLDEKDKELTKYKKAFEILKDKFNFRVFPLLIVDDEIKSMCLTYNGDYRKTIELNNEEAELLEELMKDENG